MHAVLLLLLLAPSAAATATNTGHFARLLPETQADEDLIAAGDSPTKAPTPFATLSPRAKAHPYFTGCEDDPVLAFQRNDCDQLVVESDIVGQLEASASSGCDFDISTYKQDPSLDYKTWRLMYFGRFPKGTLLKSLCRRTCSACGDTTPAITGPCADAGPYPPCWSNFCSHGGG